MQRGPDFSRAPIRPAPINETDQGHQKERFRITGNEKESRWMRDDERCAKKTQRGREIPPLTKEKKITPEPPRRDLRSDQQRVFRSKVEAITEQTRERGISREKRDVGDFHHLMVDRRDDRLIATIDDVQKPVAVV